MILVAEACRSVVASQPASFRRPFTTTSAPLPHRGKERTRDKFHFELLDVDEACPTSKPKIMIIGSALIW